jgi:F0F1-type ATP synthase membrane subunit b/b'
MARRSASVSLDGARAEIGLEINRAREELRGQVAKIAVAGAAKCSGVRSTRTRIATSLGKLASEL